MRRRKRRRVVVSLPHFIFGIFTKITHSTLPDIPRSDSCKSSVASSHYSHHQLLYFVTVPCFQSLITPQATDHQIKLLAGQIHEAQYHTKPSIFTTTVRRKYSKELQIMKKTNNELATICTICTTVLFEEEITQQTKKSIVRQEQRRCEDEPPHLVWQREREREESSFVTVLYRVLEV